MRKLILLVVIGGLSGCATAILSDDMQPDGSYRIVAGGAAFATDSSMAEELLDHAKGLCPKGYDTRSAMRGSDGAHPRHQLIVKCKD